MGKKSTKEKCFSSRSGKYFSFLCQKEKTHVSAKAFLYKFISPRSWTTILISSILLVLSVKSVCGALSASCNGYFFFLFLSLCLAAWLVNKRYNESKLNLFSRVQ